MVGPSIRIRKEVNDDFDFNGNPIDSEAYTTTAAYVNNGVLFQITENFNISLILGLGLKNNQQDSFDQFDDPFTGPDGFFEGNIGIRF